MYIFLCLSSSLFGVENKYIDCKFIDPFAIYCIRECNFNGGDIAPPEMKTFFIQNLKSFLEFSNASVREIKFRPMMLEKAGSICVDSVVD